LRIQRSPIIVAWNLEKSDRDLWFGIAAEFQVGLSWLDVSLPSVAAMIPPLEVAP
jgi:hypothetical protein